MTEIRPYLDWKNLAYLASGSPRQRHAHAAIHSLDVMRILDAYDPLLVSTISHGLDVDSSDLDIICFAPELAQFSAYVRKHFGEKPGFRDHCASEPGRERVVAQFQHDDFEFEIYGSPIPVGRQRAWLHFQQTARVLAIGGMRARQGILALRKQGLKTEPALAQFLGLEGDPYDAVEQLLSRSDEELLQLIESSTISGTD